MQTTTRSILLLLVAASPLAASHAVERQATKCSPDTAVWSLSNLESHINWNDDVDQRTVQFHIRPAADFGIATIVNATWPLKSEPTYAPCTLAAPGNGAFEKCALQYDAPRATLSIRASWKCDGVTVKGHIGGKIPSLGCTKDAPASVCSTPKNEAWEFTTKP